MSKTRWVLAAIGVLCTLYLGYRYGKNAAVTVRQTWPFLIGAFVGIGALVTRPRKRGD